MDDIAGGGYRPLLCLTRFLFSTFLSLLSFMQKQEVIFNAYTVSNSLTRSCGLTHKACIQHLSSVSREETPAIWARGGC